MSRYTGITNDDGDTLIEVILAIIILGTILFSAYSLTSRAFRLGQAARERSQATQLMQQQAEALRSLRDGSIDWSSFQSKLSAGMVTPLPIGSCSILPQASGTIHLYPAAGKWAVLSGSVKTDNALFDPEDKYADFYTLKVEGCFVGNGISAIADRFEGKVKIEWPRFGDGELETSELYINLSNRDLPAGA